MSIQVKLGGRSFSVESTTIASDTERVEFVIDTPRVTLVPREDISLDSASELLRIVGKPYHINEQCVCSDMQADIIAVIAIDSQTLSQIIEKWGSRAIFTSPLLDMRHSEEHCLVVDATDRVCYMRLFEDGLLRAEAYEAATSEDTLYYVTEWLGTRKDIPIFIKGNNDTAKLLRKYFKQVICE